VGVVVLEVEEAGDHDERWLEVGEVVAQVLVEKIIPLSTRIRLPAPNYSICDHDTQLESRHVNQRERKMR
jgi:hypothetical protein